MSVLLRAENLKKSFKKGKKNIPVLTGVDLEIQKGQTVAVTGSSGVGKSTLLHILGTLETPTSGKVLFGSKGDDVFSFSEREVARFRNRMLGFVFQFHYLLPEFSALENVMLPVLISGESRQTAKEKSEKLLDFIGLSHRLDHRPSELSGGEQQRVAIARAVILKPQLLLADELTGNLDSKNSENVVELLSELNEVTGVSILLVTHDPGLARKMDQVLIMKDGQLVG